jgi:2-C-methyl-D-erythritol 2,4-cyclodiphosphate synthase
MVLLGSAVARLLEAGWRPVQCDVTVIAEAPRLAPHIPAIRAALARVLGIAVGQVGVKGKTNEGMGFIGRGEGIAVIAVANIDPSE